MVELDLIHKGKTRKQPKTRYIKPESVRELESLCFEHKRYLQPDIPYPVKKTFRDDSANGLTKCIVAWLQLRGYFAGRVNTTGTYSVKLGKYIHSGSRKGMADITAIIEGRHVSIEVKHGKDRIRPEQLKVKQEVEQAGGLYIVASTFDDFLSQINKLNENNIYKHT